MGFVAKKKSGFLQEPNTIKSNADSTVGKLYFTNISKGTAFLLQGLSGSVRPWRRKAVPIEILVK